jgi:hypothetical protein
MPRECNLHVQQIPLSWALSILYSARFQGVAFGVLWCILVEKVLIGASIYFNNLTSLCLEQEPRALRNPLTYIHHMQNLCDCSDVVPSTDPGQAPGRPFPNHM